MKSYLKPEQINRAMTSALMIIEGRDSKKIVFVQDDKPVVISYNTDPAKGQIGYYAYLGDDIDKISNGISRLFESGDLPQHWILSYKECKRGKVA